MIARAIRAVPSSVAADQFFVGTGVKASTTRIDLPALDAITYRTTVQVPTQLLEDANFDLEAWLAEEVATEAINRAFLDGTGKGEPKGLLSAFDE